MFTLLYECWFIDSVREALMATYMLKPPTRKLNYGVGAQRETCLPCTSKAPQNPGMNDRLGGILFILRD